MNRAKKMTLITLSLIGGVLIFSGCAKNEYDDFTASFRSTYLEIAKSVDITDTLKTLKIIQSEENKRKIEELRVLLKNIENKVPDSKKDEYERYIEWHKGLVLLRDTPYNKWDKLSFKQKSAVWTEISLIEIEK